MGEDNIVLNYMSEFLEAKLANNKEMLHALRNSGKNICVKLYDVGIALDRIVDDTMNIIDYQQELQEERLRVIVESLDEVTKAKIMKKFEAADDDLFTEGENN